MADNNSQILSKNGSAIKWSASSFTLPVIFIVAFLLIFLIFLIKVHSNFNSVQKKDIYILSQRISKNIELKLKGNLEFIKILALERADGNLTEQEFQTHVAQYLKDHTEFINFTWVDSDFVIKNISPLEGNSHIIGLHIKLPEPKRVSNLAKEKKQSFYTKPFEAIQSGSSFEVWVPVFKNNEFLGLFAGVYSCERILKQAIPNEKFYERYISLLDENSVILAEFPASNSENKKIFYQSPLLSLANGMKVNVEMVKAQPFSWTMIVLITLSILLVLSFAYSLWKLKNEILFRKIIQESLNKNEIYLKQKNTEYLSLNEELTKSNNSIQKVNDELLIAKEHAEESDRLKTAFLQNMSHEIRTPMNAIMGFSSLLVDNFNNKEKLKKFSEIINQRSNDLLDIINDILDIAKIESGQLSINVEECNLNELFAELQLFFSEYQKRNGKQDIKFKLQTICDPSDYVVLADKGKLKQILINLINNAFKFTETGIIEGGCKLDEQNKYLFYVSDTGIGIPVDKHNLIFERFIQLDSGSLVGGSGLGLSIVKGLVHLLGSEIVLQSEPGKGSTFSFSLAFKTKKVLTA